MWIYVYTSVGTVPFNKFEPSPIGSNKVDNYSVMTVGSQHSYHTATATTTTHLFSPAVAHLLAHYQEFVSSGGQAKLILETCSGEEIFDFAC
jgi:hypothetical protein